MMFHSYFLMTFVYTVDKLLSILTIIGIPLVVFAFTLLFMRKGPLRLFHKEVAKNGLWLAFIIAIIATLGSLFYSEIAGYNPCKLCWLQRIFMYPLSIILLVAAIRKDRKVFSYVLPMTIIGGGIALGHYLLQLSQYTGVCVADAIDCAQSYVFYAGFVSIPLMALVAFVLISAFVLLARK